MDVTHIRLAGFDSSSIVNGNGYRFVFYTQGCPHRCHGCHNPKTHAYDKGMLVKLENCFNMIRTLYNIDPLVKGITLSGGEPFLQPNACYQIAKESKHYGYNVWTYTGFTYEELVEQDNEDVMNLLRYTSVLVDGPFIEDLKDMDLNFRGSSNQRVLYLRNGEIRYVDDTGY